MSLNSIHRVVVKLGTSTLTAGTQRLSAPRMVELVRQMAGLRLRGCDVVVVSSGAIAAGRERLAYPTLPPDIPAKQMLAAVGQPRLMSLYEQLFGLYGLTLVWLRDYANLHRVPGVALHAAEARSWLAAIGFAFQGHHTRAIPSMTTAASRARIAASQLPSHVLVVNYLAVPRERDLTDWTRSNYALLAEHGPNDGLTLLADAIVPEGITVAELGFGHFFRTPDLDRRVAAMALALLFTLERPGDFPR